VERPGPVTERDRVVRKRPFLVSMESGIHEAAFSGARYSRGGGVDMSDIRRVIDLTQIPAVPFAWVDEHVYAAIRGCSVKVRQNERRLNIGCPFRRINGTTIRYKFGDIQAFLESQPGGGGGAQPSNPDGRGPGRRRRSSALTVASD